MRRKKQEQLKEEAKSNEGKERQQRYQQKITYVAK